MSELFQVPQNLAHVAWPEIAVLIAPVVEMTDGRHTLATTLERLISGHMTAFVALENARPIMACIVQVAVYPAQKWLQIVFCRGSKMREWLPSLVAIGDAFAYNEHCEGVEFFGRGGWKRVLKPYGYIPDARNLSLVSKRLERPL